MARFVRLHLGIFVKSYCFKMVQFSVLDTTGQERFHVFGSKYYRDARKSSCSIYLSSQCALSDCALLIYDITNSASFEKVWVFWRTIRSRVLLTMKCKQVQMLVSELHRSAGTDLCIAIAGNKCDLEKNRHVSEEEALK